jgi:hypothetical protein
VSEHDEHFGDGVEGGQIVPSGPGNPGRYVMVREVASSRIITSGEAGSHFDNSVGRYQTVSMIEVSRDISSIKAS